MATRLLVWLAERCVEWLLAALMLLAVLGPSNNPRFSGIFGELYIALVAVLFFYIATGYLFSTVCFGIWGRRQRPLSQAAVMVSAFLGHCVLLMLISGGNLELKLAVFGTCIVAVTTLAGSIFLRKVEGEPDLFQSIIRK